MSINHDKNIQQNTRQTLKASGRISSADREDIPHTHYKLEKAKYEESIYESVHINLLKQVVRCGYMH